MAPSRPEGGGEAYGLQAAASPRDRSGRGLGQRAALALVHTRKRTGVCSQSRGKQRCRPSSCSQLLSHAGKLSRRPRPAQRPAASGLCFGCTAFWPEVPLEGLRPRPELSALFSPLPTQPPASSTLPKIGSQGSFSWQSGFRTSKLQGLQAITSLKLPCKDGETDPARGRESLEVTQGVGGDPELGWLVPASPTWMPLPAELA